MGPLTGVVVYRPAEVGRWEELTWDTGWWISSALKDTRAGDRLLIYMSGPDRGIVGVFDAATDAFNGKQLGNAAYGRLTPLAERRISERELLLDPVLASKFKPPVRGRLSLRSSPLIAEHLQRKVLDVRVAFSSDPLPEPGNPDWEWSPLDRVWGLETAASDTIADDPDLCAMLGFERHPGRELPPAGGSRHRTDLMGRDRNGHILICEVKHLVATSSLNQLDGYLAEARAHGARCMGHLIALHAYTPDVANAVSVRNDVALWVCEQDDLEYPELVHVAGPHSPKPA